MYYTKLQKYIIIFSLQSVEDLCDLLHFYKVGKMSTNYCWMLTCDGLVSCPVGVNDSHPLNTTETEAEADIQ